MAWKNLDTMIQSEGNLADFFKTIKDVLLSSTGFEFDEDNSNMYKLVFNTNINNMKMQISDSAITIDNTTTTSSNLKVTFYTYNEGMSHEYCTRNILYGNSLKGDAEGIRRINIKIANYPSFFGLSISRYSENPSHLGECGLHKVTGIDFYNNHQDMILISNSSNSEINCYNSDYTTKYSLNKFINTAADGLVMENATYSNADTKTIKGYINGLYNCSTISTGYHYLINGKQYYALTDNYILKL